MQGQLPEQLLAENLVTSEQLETVLHRVRSEGSRLEDALIDSGVVSEADLLKFLAKLYRTRFVATNKLARAEVDRGLLEVIPRKLAEQHQVFPVLFDPSSSTLSVVSPDAGDPAIVEAVRTRQTPPFTRDVEKIVYDFVTEYLETNRVAAPNYKRAIDAFGEQGVVDLVGVCGYYMLVSMKLNVFEMALPPGEPEPLA